MFDMEGFIKTNLIKGYWEGSFSKTQINIFALNYLAKGMINQDDFDYIMEKIEPREDENTEE